MTKILDEMTLRNSSSTFFFFTREKESIATPTSNRSCDRLPKLFQLMFPDSVIAKSLLWDEVSVPITQILV